ncbi:MAG: response regulator transcription factor [Spirochaetota bacterium]|nr:response regulator transcription factor [Spirochaetota bacterium]
MKKLIYVIDDEKDIQEILNVNLSKEGYDVKTFSSAEEALKIIDKDYPELILLDIMMDGMDGYDFCKEIRQNDQLKLIPIIFLSAKSEEFDRVLGLELGGDDYIVKPFGIKELISRVKAVLRRGKIKNDETEKNLLRYDGVELYPDKYLLKIDGNNVKVTKTEFEILHLFMKYPGKVFTRNNIIDSVKGEDIFVIDRTIDVHIMNLRKKLGKHKKIITTFPGVGYGLKE